MDYEITNYAKFTPADREKMYASANLSETECMFFEFVFKYSIRTEETMIELQRLSSVMLDGKKKEYDAITKIKN